MKKATANVNWHLFTECPHCLVGFDLADQDEDGFYSQRLFSDKFLDLEGEEAECPECGETFLIGAIEF